MDDPSGELQAAIIAVLMGQTGAEDRVFDEPQVNPVYPYITLGECQVLPDKADCIDGVEAYPKVDVWSQEKGFVQVKAVAKTVLALLDDQPLVVDGFNVILFEVESVNYLRDPNGLDRHAVITFHTLIQPS